MDDALGRRGFLKTGAAAAAATAAAAAGSCGRADSRWRVLSEREAATLTAACEQIIPTDQDPGAADANVVAFIDKQLATRQKQDLPWWRAGLAGLDGAARGLHGTTFAELAGEEQVALLQATERGEGRKEDWGRVAPGDFFRRLRLYTMMGFYGDPRHGGNRNRVAWTMIGMPDPPVRGRLHETPPPPALAPRPAKTGAPVTAPALDARKG